MAEQVSAEALIDAVGAFLQGIEGELSGRSGFHAKVAANALAIVARELAQKPFDAEAAALGAFLGHAAPVAALGGFLGHAAPVAALRAEICGRLRMGQLTPETPGLVEALVTATVAKVAVDNPRYSTLGRMR